MVIQMDNYNYHIQDNMTKLNGHIDDAFVELDAQRNRINGLTKECIELKHELLRLHEKQKFESLILRIIIGIIGFLCVIQTIFDICISE